MAKPKQVQEVVKKYFEKNNYRYNVEKEGETFVLYSGFGTAIENGTVGIVLVVYDDGINLVATYSEEQQLKSYAAIAEFLLRINRFLKRGHYYLDYEAGTINFKTWSYIKGKITVNDVEDMISLTVGSIEKCIPEITSIKNGELTPIEAEKDYIKEGGSDK